MSNTQQGRRREFCLDGLLKSRIHLDINVTRCLVLRTGDNEGRRIEGAWYINVPEQ